MSTLKCLPCFFAISVMSFFFFSLSIAEKTENQQPVVQTTYGRIMGVTRRITYRSEQIDHTFAFSNLSFFNLFLGVPYAQAPIEELRFEKPLPPKPWQGVYEALIEPPACVPNVRPEAATSVQTVFSEDCLYANIIAPHNDKSCSTLYPVLVLIHGGFFSIGSARQFNNYNDIAEKFVARGIVVVVLQYRLGFLGFASLGDKEMPGNLGLWDQLASLRFINSNIVAFCGDATRVTLWGYSAGSVSVGAHVVSPHSQGLFRAAFQMSGSLMSAKTQGRWVVRDTHDWLFALGCNHTETMSVKKCIRQKSIDQMHAAVEDANPVRLDVNFVKFQPRIDGDFFPGNYVSLFASAPPKPTIVGFNDLEALTYSLLPIKNTSTSSFAISLTDRINYDRNRFETFVREVIAKEEYFGRTEAREVAAAINLFFEEYEQISMERRDSAFFLKLYTEMLSDLFYVLPILWEHMIKVQANPNWRIWMYQHRHYNNASFLPHVPLRGSFHGNDHEFLFPPPDEHRSFMPTIKDVFNERWLSEVLANFVIAGDPSKSIETSNWTPTDASSPLRHVSIRWDESTSGRPVVEERGFHGAFMRRLEFWHRLVEAHPRHNLISGMPAPQFAAEMFSKKGTNVKEKNRSEL